MIREISDNYDQVGVGVGVGDRTGAGTEVDMSQVISVNNLNVQQSQTPVSVQHTLSMQFGGQSDLQVQQQQQQQYQYQPYDVALHYCDNNYNNSINMSEITAQLTTDNIYNSSMSSKAKYYDEDIINESDIKDCDYSPQSNQNVSVETPVNGSQNVENSQSNKTENASEQDILNNEGGSFPYLQGIGSDLMQFSQQSDLERLMNENLSAVVSARSSNLNSLDVLPNFDEHDTGGYNFSLDFDSLLKDNKQRDWIYSKELNKAYISRNKILSTDIKYTPKESEERLQIRAFLCFKRAVSEPVLRCQNHICEDNASLEDVRPCFLRCLNPNVQYYGNAQGKNIKDRYSVVVPLGRATPGDDNCIRQTLEFQFKCQNSCLRRKETSMFFLLENKRGEILAKRTLDIKVCSCPKRDKAADESNDKSNRKRKVSEESYASCKKVRKSAPASIKLEQETTDTEPDDTDYGDENSLSSNEMDRIPYGVQRTTRGGYRIVLETSSKSAALAGIEAMVNKVAASIINQPKHKDIYMVDYRQLKRLHDRIERLL